MNDKEYLKRGRHKSVALLEWLIALAVGVFGLWRFHIAQFSSALDTFPADRGDGRLITYLCEHWYQVFQGRAVWRSPAMFYPTQGALGYADMFLGYAVPFSILRAAGLDVFTSLEVVVILFNYLAYVICFILLYKILRLGAVASCAGAFFFAFNSPKLVQMGHLQLQVVLFLPLALIFVLMFVKRRESVSQGKAFALLALAVTCLSIQLMSGYYPGWFFIFWSFLFLSLGLLVRSTRAFILSTARKFWRPIAGAVLLFIAEMIPFLMVYVPVVRELGWRPYDSVKELLPVPKALLLMGNANYVWGGLSAKVMQAYKLHPELQIGIGLVPSLAWLALTVAAILFMWRRRKTQRDEGERPSANLKLLWLCLVILSVGLFYLIGMKFWGELSAWRLVFSFFPGGKSIRAVARYVIVLALPMSIVFAFLIQHALDRALSQRNIMKRTLLLAALFAAICFGLFEQMAEGFGFSVKAENAYLERLAKRLPDNCRSFYLTVGPKAVRNQFEYQIDAMMVSQMRGVPTANGYSGQFPRDWFPALWEVKEPGYEEKMKGWIDGHKLTGVCRLVVDESMSMSNEIDEDEFFVRQQYLDVLSREPDTAGLRNWVGTLKNCPKVNNEQERLNPRCDRAHVATGFLQSSEFSINYFIYYFYRAVMGRVPTSKELSEDRQRLAGVPLPEQEAGMKRELVTNWMSRADFKEMYDGLSDEEFVDRLVSTSGVSVANRGELVDALRGGRKGRADVLREFLESRAVYEKFNNAGFVFMQYDRLLRREPDEAGQQEWVKLLEQTGDYRRVTDSFINGAEYRRRFRQIY
ncbi:MAG TPA: DUF4214 domain-containing protein [Pyrinomonadaceae bacterium]|nr:DUF4214 domain-containing protein [Pyrinomonadaceae bacterium]